MEEELAECWKKQGKQGGNRNEGFDTFLEEVETDLAKKMSGGWDDEFEHFMAEEEAEHLKKLADYLKKLKATSS